MYNPFYEPDYPFHTSPWNDSYDLNPSDGITGLEIASPLDMLGFDGHSIDETSCFFELPHDSNFPSSDVLISTPPPSDELPSTPPPSGVLFSTPLSEMTFPPSENIPYTSSTVQFEECTSQEPVHYGLADLNTQVPPPCIADRHVGENKLAFGGYSPQKQYEDYQNKYEEFSQKKTQLQQTGSKSRPKMGRLESLNLVAFNGIEGKFGSSKDAFCCSGIVTLQPGRGCVLVKLKTIQKANPEGELAKELRRADEGARKGVEEMEKVGRMVWNEGEEHKNAMLVSTGKEVFSSKILMSTITKITFRPTEASTESSMGRGGGGGGGERRKEHFLLQIFTSPSCLQEDVMSLVVWAAEKDVRRALDVFVHGVRYAKENGTKGMLKGEPKMKGMMTGQEILILEGKFVPDYPPTHAM